jgi:hypothetical protein
MAKQNLVQYRKIHFGYNSNMEINNLKLLHMTSVMV